MSGGVSHEDFMSLKVEHGIYKYDAKTDKWVKTKLELTDGVHVIYFDNTKCFACRLYDIEWFPTAKAVSEKEKNVTFWIILCDWFAKQCDSEEAASEFEKFNVTASPTTFIIAVNGGKKIFEKKQEGYLRHGQLLAAIEEGLEALRAKTGASRA